MGKKKRNYVCVCVCLTNYITVSTYAEMLRIQI